MTNVDQGETVDFDGLGVFLKVWSLVGEVPTEQYITSLYSNEIKQSSAAGQLVSVSE